MDVALSGEKINSFEREILNTTDDSVNHNDTETCSHCTYWEDASRRIETRNIAVRVGPLGQIDSWSLWKRYEHPTSADKKSDQFCDQ